MAFASIGKHFLSGCALDCTTPSDGCRARGGSGRPYKHVPGLAALLVILGFVTRPRATGTATFLIRQPALHSAPPHSHSPRFHTQDLTPSTFLPLCVLYSLCIFTPIIIGPLHIVHISHHIRIHICIARFHIFLAFFFFVSLHCNACRFSLVTSSPLRIPR